MDITKMRIQNSTRERSNSASSEDTSDMDPAILDDLSDKARSEEGLLEWAASERLPGHRDHVEDSARELPFTQGSSPRGSVLQKDEINELPPATTDQIVHPQGTSTPVQQTLCLQNRSAQTTDAHEKTQGVTIPTTTTRDSTTQTSTAQAGLHLASPSSPGTAPKTSPAKQDQPTTQQDVLSTINCNEVTPYKNSQPNL